MKLEATLTRTAPTLGYICDVATNTKAVAEADEYDWRMISPGYFLCIHGETAYVISEYARKISCACQHHRMRLKGDDVCKHLVAFMKLENLPSKPIDADMGQLLKAAGWIGRKLHPPALPKPGKKKLPNIPAPALKPAPTDANIATVPVATKADRMKRFDGMTPEQIIAEMDNATLKQNAGRGAPMAIAELERRKAAGVI